MNPSHARNLILDPQSALRVDDSFCPFCEQQIPHDRLEEVHLRISSKRRDWTEELEANLTRDMSEALLTARREADAAIAEARRASEAKIEAARIEERTAAAAAAAENLEAIARGHETTIQALRDEAERLRLAGISALEEVENARRKMVVERQLKTDAEEKIQQVLAESARKEQEIRDQALQAAKSAVQAEMDAVQVQHAEIADALRQQLEGALGESAKRSEEAASLQEQLEAQRVEAATAIELIREESRVTTERVKSEATAEATAAAAERIASLDAVNNDLTAKLANSESVLADRLHEQREALAADKASAINVEREAAAGERIKLIGQVEELQRTLAKKTAEEIGEGAEVNLFEDLKERFPDDYVEQVEKGAPGADIIHHVKVCGREIGRIIYDSKDRNAWRNEFVSKLAQDQIAADAAHAILSTRKFPSGVRQVDLQDGVIIANPARVLALVEIIRRHMLSIDVLRMSNECRAQKTEELYAFITSDRFADLFKRIDRFTEDLLDLQEAEKKSHDNHWKKEGKLLRDTQKVHAELQRSIDEIIGTVEAASELVE